MPLRYSIAACQTNVWPVFTDESMTPHWENFEKNMDRACELVSYNARAGGARLYVFSEFFLSGSPSGSNVDAYRACAITLPGPELDQLGAVAKKRGVHIAGMAYEKDDVNWPGRVFNTLFILGPDGDLILKYRKHYDQTCKTKPGDVWDDYVQKVGIDNLHPVVDTELGRLGGMVCFDVNFFENARTLALKGCEVMIHPTSEGRSYYHMQDVGGWEMARRVRAYENIAYWVSANQAWRMGSAAAKDFSHGHSQIVDFTGQVLNIADTSAETIVAAEVDIEALRRRRTTVGMNFLIQAQPHLYAEVLRRKQLWPKNLHRDAPVQSGRQNNEEGVRVVKRMTEAGIFAPAAYAPAVNLNRPG
jgi:predicted amidohydrolase